LVASVVLCREMVKRIVHMDAQGIQRNCYELQVSNYKTETSAK